MQYFSPTKRTNGAHDDCQWDDIEVSTPKKPEPEPAAFTPRKRSWFDASLRVVVASTPSPKRAVAACLNLLRTTVKRLIHAWEDHKSLKMLGRSASLLPTHSSGSPAGLAAERLPAPERPPYAMIPLSAPVKKKILATRDQNALLCCSTPPKPALHSEEWQRETV
ncbi:hypothetical protein M885DRAFT_505261 [Pelagophyceae sp. CCMP2097]|nr:hypothetical protein M885DRAFT_505261 [Pelagophyceae sp. CCMP2097]